ncbi:MAG: hypothetical protein M3500_05090 [Actinomycetota bacterium]|nr:hypothetical protein [Actinomycetota bacterium]
MTPTYSANSRCSRHTVHRRDRQLAIGQETRRHVVQQAERPRAEGDAHHPTRALEPLDEDLAAGPGDPRRTGQHAEVDVGVRQHVRGERLRQVPLDDPQVLHEVFEAGTGRERASE